MRWARGLAGLRRIARDLGLVETVKWGHPCYMHAGRNLVLFGALREDMRLGFFNAALLTDPEGLLSKSGPNTRHPDCMRFFHNEDVGAKEQSIRRYLREAMDYAERGIKPVKEAQEIELPEELTEAMEADAELAEAFGRLTPGRQRSYVIALAGAKKPETRVARILKYRPHILAGKGALER